MEFFIWYLIFSIVLSNEKILNEFDRLEEVEIRLHNNVRDEELY